jgi:hypothetical protein
MNTLHDIMREVHTLLNAPEYTRDRSSPHSTEYLMATVNWRQALTSPQAVVSLLTAAVTALATAGILDVKLAGSVQSLLVAVLSVITAATHVTVTATMNQRTVRQMLEKAVDE